MPVLQVRKQLQNPPANVGDKSCGLDPRVGKNPQRRTWQPTPVFLPGKSNGQMSLAGYSPWGHKDSDMTWGLNPHRHIQKG